MAAKKTRKPTPTEIALNEAKVKLAEAEAALKAAQEKNAPLVLAAQAKVEPLGEVYRNLQKKLREAESKMLLEARIRLPNDTTLGPWHPDLMAAVEKALGVSYEQRERLRPGNVRWGYAKGADPFNEALNAIQTRAILAHRQQPEIVALEAQVDAAYIALSNAQGEVYDVQRNTRPAERDVSAWKRTVDELEEKIAKNDERREARQYAKEMVEEEDAYDAAKYRSVARSITDGSLSLTW